ncbi:threo-3-hydroxy-L-aspartate ammonia-lyase [Pokkaliibacter sp. CJK22405]|uniref:threo-3-hydroxy-L-aspartate ammonia-lyase n=1 Tax=Pokkaliibacter sp. CJK22405 TaxID=3384615 RepID=UPI003985044F
MSTLALPTFADVQDAARRLKGIAHRTPVMTSSQLDTAYGASIFIKCENLQRMGAFKFRGAYNALSRLDAAQQQRGVVAFSSGNHAQAVALAGRELGIPATIVMPEDAPKAKVAATKGYGGKVVFYNRYTEDRAAIAAQLAQEQGLAVIPPFDHPDIIAGQGTAALELFEDVGPLDILLVCTGGGGLMGGSALAAVGMAPGCEVIGVEPEAGNDAQQSLAAGRIITIDTPKTLADGAQTQAMGALTFALMREHVSQIMTVDDQALIDTMAMLAGRFKLVVEPTGALATAALKPLGADLKGKKVGVIISGGNVDMPTYSQLLAKANSYY